MVRRNHTRLDWGKKKDSIKKIVVEAAGKEQSGIMRRCELVSTPKLLSRKKTKKCEKLLSRKKTKKCEKLLSRKKDRNVMMTKSTITRLRHKYQPSFSKFTPFSRKSKIPRLQPKNLGASGRKFQEKNNILLRVKINLNSVL